MKKKTHKKEFVLTISFFFLLGVFVGFVIHSDTKIITKTETVYKTDIEEKCEKLGGVIRVSTSYINSEHPNFFCYKESEIISLEELN